MHLHSTSSIPSPPPSPPDVSVPSPVPPPDSEDPDIDVVSVDLVPDLPYDERKVRSIMLECSRHLNLVRPLAEATSLPLERVVAEAGYQQRMLLSRLVRILEGDLLARLACSNVRVPLSVSVCVVPSVSVCLLISCLVCQSVYLSVCVSVCLSVCLSVFLSVCLSVC